MAMLKPQRSLVLKEATGLLSAADQLRTQVGLAPTTGVTPMISDPKLLHSFITRMEDHLVQLKVLLQHRS